MSIAIGLMSNCFRGTLIHSAGASIDFGYMLIDLRGWALLFGGGSTDICVRSTRIERGSTVVGDVTTQSSVGMIEFGAALVQIGKGSIYPQRKLIAARARATTLRLC